MSYICSAACLLILAGDEPRGLARADLEALLQKQPYIIAADGGANYLAAHGIAPNMLVGDGDSLDETTLAFCRKAGVSFNPLPQEKDFTDGEAAFCAAFKLGYKQIGVFGALGGNLDHQLGNLLLPLAYRQNWQQIIFYGPDCRAFYCFNQVTITGTAGDTISLLPLSSTVTGLTLNGFKYPLNKAVTKLGASLCLRNQLSAHEARVQLTQGIMLIIHYPQR